jgi:hypothetical protein
MPTRWPRLVSPAGLMAAVLMASPASWAAESPAAAAALEGVDVATGHLFNALLYLPVGLTAAVLFLEFFAQWKKNREVEPAILFLLFGAAAAAAGVAALAYAFSPVGRASGQLSMFASWMAVVVGVVSVAFYCKRQARNQRLFSLKPVPQLSGKIVIPRTSAQKSLIVGYRVAAVCAFLLALVGVSEMPLSQAPAPSLAAAVRTVIQRSTQPAPGPAEPATPLTADLAPPPPKPSTPASAPAPSLATLLGTDPSAAAPASATTAQPAESPATSAPATATPPPETSATTGTMPPEAATRPPEPTAPATPAPAVTATAKPPTPAPASVAKPAATGSKLPANFFATKIKPVLDAKCVDCHGASKQKGDLRLDSVAAIKQGTGNPVVVGGDLELSSLYQRLITPDDEDLMPPRDKGGPLAPNAIAMVKAWIQAGADFGDGASAPGKAPTAAAAPGGKLEEEKSRSLTAPSADLLTRLTDGGAVIRPMSANGALIDVNLTHFEAGPVNLADLTPIAKNILALDVSRTKLKDDDLAPIAGMSNLVRLELKRNAITDTGLEHLKGLAELESLNLFDTQVTDAGLQHLTGLKRLQKIFLFNTKVTPDGAAQLRKAIPGVVVNLGE